MSEEHVLYEVGDGIATITLNRPEALNALLPEMNDRLPELVDRAEADDAVRVIVLTGAGKAFSAGADLKLMGRPERLGRSALVGRARTLHGARVVERLLRREKPMIAAVNGVAAGMACSFVLACDFAIAADRRPFRLQLRQGRIHSRLRRHVPAAAARRPCQCATHLPDRGAGRGGRGAAPRAGERGLAGRASFALASAPWRRPSPDTRRKRFA